MKENLKLNENQYYYNEIKINKSINYSFKNYLIFKLSILFCLINICLFLIFIYNLTFKERNKKFNKLFIYEINKSFKENEFVNINEIESKLKGGRKWLKNKDKSKEINIGVQLDPSYVLRCMMTFASIIDSQKPTTKLRFHSAVVLEFTIKEMIKIYSLRDKIREDVEFNFYNAKRVETDLQGLNIKGPGAVAKLLLPQLLPNDVEKLIVFDTGDLLVLRDLSEMYNWNMKNYSYLGVGCIGLIGHVSKKFINYYINVGHFLINVTQVKKDNMYEKFKKNKNAYSSIVGDQHLLNDVADGKISYLPMKFGLISPYKNDKDSDNFTKKHSFFYYNRVKYKEKFSFLPKNSDELIKHAYNPVVIHQTNGKWQFGAGITVYRRLAQYYIKLAGIWDEM